LVTRKEVNRLKDRIKKLRKELDLTQRALADRIGMKQNTIATYEMGRANPSDQCIRSICREFGVNENWLRTGEGEMFVELSIDKQIATFIGSTQLAAGDSFKKRFISMLSRLDEAEWELLEKMALELHKEEG
jgi:transcriptional regulator with XRE-family HTH domain